MRERQSGSCRRKRSTRWWPLPVLVGMALVVVVIAVSASTTAPQDVRGHRTQLSTRSWFGAYPDIGAGLGGLVAVVWTEGSDLQNKHRGPLKLAWISDDSQRWSVVTVDGATVDGDRVYDAAVAVRGSRIHIVWSRDQGSAKAIRYTSCLAPACSSFSPEPVAVGQDAFQVDIALDGNGNPHVVWVEKDNDKKGRLYYTHKQGTWRSKVLVQGSSDSEGPAIAYGSEPLSNGYVHIVWTEWLSVDHSDAAVKYRRRDVDTGSWSAATTLSDWASENYLARNLSIAADASGNVYAVWDHLDFGGTQYVIGYVRSGNNGQNWRDVHTYLQGTQFGTSAVKFDSAEASPIPEYAHFLRPYVGLALSGTVSVPVLSWHRKTPAVIVPEGAGATAVSPYKVLWSYATRPGSDQNGYMYWKKEQGKPFSMTLSTNYWGDPDVPIDSATAQVVPVGDLKQILDTENPNGYLHVAYHERTSGDFWGVIYNSNKPPPDRFDLNVPLIFKNYNSSNEG